MICCQCRIFTLTSNYCYQRHEWTVDSIYMTLQTIHFLNYKAVMFRGCRARMWFFKLFFCVVLCGQKGHWNCGSFPHSCLTWRSKVFFHWYTFPHAKHVNRPGLFEHETRFRLEILLPLARRDSSLSLLHHEPINPGRKVEKTAWNISPSYINYKYRQTT